MKLYIHIIFTAEWDRHNHLIRETNGRRKRSFEPLCQLSYLRDAYISTVALFHGSSNTFKSSGDAKAYCVCVSNTELRRAMFFNLQPPQLSCHRVKHSVSLPFTLLSPLLVHRWVGVCSIFLNTNNHAN